MAHLRTGNSFIFTGKLCALAACAALLALAGPPARAQDSPALPVPLTSSHLAPEEVQRIEKKKALEEIMPRIRSLFALGQYEDALKEIENAEKIDPGNPSLKLYRDWVKVKMETGEGPLVGRTAATPFPGTQALLGNRTATSSTATPSASVTAGLPDGGLPPAQTPNAVSTPTSLVTAGAGRTNQDHLPAAAPSGADAAAKSSRNRLVLIGALGLLVIVLLLVVVPKLRSKKTPPAPVAARRATAGPLPTPVPPPVAARPNFEATISPEQMASDIAHNINSMEAGDHEAAPSFDFTVGAGTGLNSQPTEYHENAPTIMDADVLEDSEAFDGTLPNVSPPPAPKPAAEKGQGVSFEDLGIVLFPPTTPAAPNEPSAEEPKPLGEEEPPPPLPAESVPANKTPIRLDIPAPEVPSEPAPMHLTPVRLEIPLPKEPPKNAPKTPMTIDLEDLLFGKPSVAAPETPASQATPAESKTAGKEGTQTVTPSRTPGSPVSRAPEPTAPPPKPPPAPEHDIIILPDMPSSMPAPQAPKPVDETYGLAAETLHGQDTIRIPNMEFTLDSAMERPPEHPDDKLAATATINPSRATPSEGPIPLAPPSLDSTHSFGVAPPPPTPPSQPAKPEEQSFYATPSPRPPDSTGGGMPSQLDERSEKMFLEQYDRATKAYDGKNWKQAVHYLSIAAAIHPDNDELREKLKHARDEKRRQEQEG